MLPSEKQVKNRKLGIYRPVVFNKKSRDDFNGLFFKLSELKGVPLFADEIKVSYFKDEVITFELPFRFMGREYSVFADDVELLYVKVLHKVTELQGKGNL